MPRKTPKQIRDIDYTSKDFDSIKRDLIQYIKRHFPEDYQDFNEASGGMAMIEALAYVGDLLSYQIDQAVNETFLERATEERNVFGNSRMLGYNPKFATPAVVNLSISADLNTSTSANEFCVLQKGSKIVTSFSPPVTFETIEDIDFSLSANRSVIDNGNGFTTVSISGVSAVAGQMVSFKTGVGNAIPFLKLTLPDRNVSEIVSVSSSNGIQYTQVRNLAQETIFAGDQNSNSSLSSDVPLIMKLKKVPHRFIVEKEPNQYTSVVFGGGTLTTEDEDVIPNPEDFVLPPSMRGSASGFIPENIDPTNFLKTKTLGSAPTNTTIFINYRIGGGLFTNVGSRTLNSFLEKNVYFKTSLDSVSQSRVVQSISVNNPEPATGGKDPETLAEIKRNANAYFATQDRCVSLQDYQVRLMSMPSKFGSVFRSFARKDPENQLGVELSLVSQNSSGQLIEPSSVLTNNIETYLREYKSFSDTIRITSGKIIDIGVEFSIVPHTEINDKEALLKAILKIREIFDISNSNFNEFISLSDVTSEIQNQPEIRSVPNLKIVNFTNTINGRSYSNYKFDVKSNTSRGIVSFPPNTIWQLKYPNFDIVGRIE